MIIVGILGHWHVRMGTASANVFRVARCTFSWEGKCRGVRGGQRGQQAAERESCPTASCWLQNWSQISGPLCLLPIWLRINTSSVYYFYLEIWKKKWYCLKSDSARYCPLVWRFILTQRLSPDQCWTQLYTKKLIYLCVYVYKLTHEIQIYLVLMKLI